LAGAAPLCDEAEGTLCAKPPTAQNKVATAATVHEFRPLYRFTLRDKAEGPIGFTVAQPPDEMFNKTIFPPLSFTSGSVIDQILSTAATTNQMIDLRSEAR